ncbi:MAG: hypothetical protein VX460_04135, partial [Planctomycetota bacterium]|nr:hypothetical protein [Planctomycetota bacterium]
SEHPCDGVWIDLDAVLDAAGEEQLDEAASVAARLGVTGLVGGTSALGRTRVPESLGTLLRGTPEERAPWDLALASDPSTLDEASAWCARTGGQLVLPEATIRSLGAGALDRLGSAGAVAAIWSEDAEGEALELARSADDWTGFHGGLEFATAFRAGAGALAGPIPILHPGLAMALHELCRDHVERAHDAERRLARWLETSLLPASRAVGLERRAISRAALEVGGWLSTGRLHLGDAGMELRRELIELLASLHLRDVVELWSDAP